jgi:hypothetical protein
VHCPCHDTVTHVVALARNMQTWCSPHGIAMDYAGRLAAAVLGIDEPIKYSDALKRLDEEYPRDR